MVLIVGISFNFPEPFLEGLATTRLVLLSGERCLILGEGREVLRTNSNGTGYGYEAVTDADFLLRESGRTNVGVTLADVDTRAVRIRGSSFAVGTDQVITVVVTIALFRLCQGTFNVLDTRRIRYFSHNRVFFMVNTMPNVIRR